jgi:hypothetical protein
MTTVYVNMSTQIVIDHPTNGGNGWRGGGWVIGLLWPVGGDVTMAAQIVPPADKGVGKAVVDNG